mgnify:FL=1
MGKDDLDRVEDMIKNQKELDSDIKKTIYENMDKLIDETNIDYKSNLSSVEDRKYIPAR